MFQSTKIPYRRTAVDECEWLITLAILTAITVCIMAPRTAPRTPHQEIHFTLFLIHISPFIYHATMSAIALSPTSCLLNTTDEDCQLNFNGEGYCGSYVKFYHQGNAVKLVDDLIHQSSTSVTEDIIFTYARQIWSGGIVFLVVALFSLGWQFNSKCLCIGIKRWRLITFYCFKYYVGWCSHTR